MIKLPSGVDINNLIDDIRIFSWEAADILLYYSKLLENSNYKKNILKNNNEEDPVTLADLKVNELIIKGINEKYKNVKWDILSEENVKISPKNFGILSEELCLLKLISLFAILNLFIIFFVCLVSSQATKETFLRIFNAL